MQGNSIGTKKEKEKHKKGNGETNEDVSWEDRQRQARYYSELAWSYNTASYQQYFFFPFNLNLIITLINILKPPFFRKGAKLGIVNMN